MSGNRTPARRPATAALLFGLLALAAIPAGCAVAAYRDEIEVLDALVVAVPAAFVLGLIAVSLSRRARARFERSVRRAGGGLVRAAALVAWSGVYVAVTGGLALAFYGVLRASS
jgi:hypothetical protein